MYPNCMPDIMILAQVVLQIFCSQCCFTTQNDKVWKGRLFSQIFREFLPKVYQVIYTLDTICELNIMSLAQAVLQIFCSQGPLWVKCLSKKGNNSVKFWQNFMKSQSGDLHNVPKLYAWYHDPSSSVFLTFCSQCCFTTQNAKVRKGRYFSQIVLEFCQKLIRSSTSWIQSVNQISWS